MAIHASLFHRTYAKTKPERKFNNMHGRKSRVLHIKLQPEFCLRWNVTSHDALYVIHDHEEHSYRKS